MPALTMISPSRNGQQNRKDSKNNNAAREQLKSNKENAQSVLSLTSSVNRTVFVFSDPPQNNDDVIVTHIRSANSYYIRAYNNNDEYMRNANDFDQAGKNGKRLLSTPQRDDLVLVKNKGKFLRGCVLCVKSENFITVALADIGEIIHTSVYQMRRLSDDLKSRKRYNFKVTLDHIPTIMNHGFVRNQTIFTLQFDGDNWNSGTNYRLLVKDNGVNVGHSMTNGITNDTPSLTENTEVPSICSGQSKKTKFTLQDMYTQKLPNIVDLIIIDNANIAMGYVRAIAAKDQSKYFALLEVQTYGDSTGEIHTPEPDEICLVKSEDNEWNRAVQYQFKYLLIDWGDLVDIADHNIRRLPAELSEPCVTFTCCIEGFTKERLDDIEKLLQLNSKQPNCVCIKNLEKPQEYFVTFPAVKEMIEK